MMMNRRCASFERILLVLGLLLIVVAAGSAKAQNFDISRWPPRLPDWLWQNGSLRPLFDDDDIVDLQIAIKHANALGDAGRGHEQDIENAKIARSLASMVARRDAVRLATIVTDPTSNRKMALFLDPQFSPDLQEVLKEAVSIVLRFATNDDIIGGALDASVERAEPFPSQTIIVDGKSINNPAYQNYLQSKSKPHDSNEFKRDMANALSPDDGVLPLLVISRYSGNVWWGGAYYDFYNMSSQQLQRLRPQGYFYIRLNSDRMTSTSPHVHEPEFWAAKIAHEMLHNLGYWHPNYLDPAERDRSQQGPAKSFMVTYEELLYEQAKKAPR
jgi:hypothetical protein